MAGKDTTRKLLSVYGITSFNKWIRLPQITIIFLDQDANFFIDSKRQIFYFDMNDEILYYSEDDKYEKETVLKSGLSDYTTLFQSAIKSSINQITSTYSKNFD